MKKNRPTSLRHVIHLAGTFALLGSALLTTASQAASLANAPLFVAASQPPLIMLTMARDHKLYYEAYNDYSDLNGDGVIDTGYKPSIEYYGYFDSYKCYNYSGGIFTPVAMSDSTTDASGKTVYTKKCVTAGDYWSGDFLNYVTTARIDALRKVLYGGYRSTDTAGQTILERSFIPQDAHTWGKEYKDTATDGYDITEYTPLSQPTTGKRHLFANVTLNKFGDPPFMRVLTNSGYRIWEWVSIERPVAGDECAVGNNVRANCTAGSLNTGFPNSAADFQDWVDKYANAANNKGSIYPSNIDAGDDSGKPAAVPADYYFDITKGTLTTGNSTGDYYFSVDGDDAVEVLINGTVVAGYYGAHGECGHGGCGSFTAIHLEKNTSYTIEFRHQEGTLNSSWHLYWKRPTSGSWQIVPDTRLSGLVQTFYVPMTASPSVMTDYNVRVEVCKTITGAPASAYFGRESNCKSYTDGAATPTITYKPTGLLHSYGDNNGMFFGLLSGSYDQNTNGGVLRKAMASITNEVEHSTGIFKESGSTCGLSGSSTCVEGIVGTINRFHITSFRYGKDASGNNLYDYTCGWIKKRQMNDGECEMWGNPLAEMMYEATRYFSGATSATAAFTTSHSRDDGVVLPGGTSGLPIASWSNPYSASVTAPIADTGPFPTCSKPYLMLISDVYPSFDSDHVPGADTNFGSVAAENINGHSLDAAGIGSTLWGLEYGGPQKVFIGQVGATYDGAPTPKTVSSFGDIRGLSPSDPSRQGSYYAASVANFGKLNDLNAVSGDQKLATYSIALSAPLPTIQIPAGGKTITLVPFAKSVYSFEDNPISSAKGDFQPTNQIVDFYVDTIKNVKALHEDDTVNDGRPYYKFRINYEDVEQGADHDMDAIALYEIKLNADNTVTVKVDSTYAAGGIVQHMGYVISGTTADGIYLVVRDSDTGYASDVEYFLDRPKVGDAGADSSYHLPVKSSGDPDVPDASNYATRTFTADSASSSAMILKDPLWYASKYGGFSDNNGNDKPDLVNEWDADSDGVPDTYYLVVNPLKLLSQLDKALAKIRDSSGTAASTTANSFSLQSDTKIYVSRYDTSDWSGDLIAYPATTTGMGTADWHAQVKMAEKTPTNRVIMTYDPDQTTDKGIAFRWSSMTDTSASVPIPVLRTALNKNSLGTADSLGSDRVSFLRGESISGMRTRPLIKDTTSTNLLGDIINSQSQYIGRPNAGHADSTYANFSNDYDAVTNTSGKGNRTPMVYVGANDGMLHGFRADTGEELLAYVPGEMYRARNGRMLLSKLTETDYGKAGSSNEHRYYVDATPTIGDICLNENVSACTDGNWRSILVGALGGGGQGIFALDVTDPANFTEAKAKDIVKWEFSDKNDADMGYTVGRPYLVKLCTERVSGACTKWTWHVLMNNGYNNTEADGYASTSGDAALLVLNAKTGVLVKKINVLEGDTTTSGPNGLSEISPIDVDGDGVVDYVYAGDLKGNLWRFDFTTIVSSSKIAFGTAVDPKPLYVAKDTATTPATQPITTAPDVMLHPNGGLLVVFGTGKYLFKNDDQSTQKQTIYGIWDKLDGNTVDNDRSKLQQQTISTATFKQKEDSSFEGKTSTNEVTYKTVSDASVNWDTKHGWYIDLPVTGERVAYNPAILGGSVLRFNTIVPSTDICEAGGTSWEYFVNALTGGRLDWSAFSNVDGMKDFGGISAYASGRQSTTGITSPGAMIGDGTGVNSGKKTVFGSGSKGSEAYGTDLGKGASGRLSWRELMSD